MIQIQALAQTIEEELNGNLNAIAFDQHFKIHATVGEYRKASIITAHYITSSSEGGNFATKAALLSATTFYYAGETITPKNYDYAVVTADETHSNNTTEYEYQSGEWIFVKVLTQIEIEHLEENVGKKRKYINGVLRSSAGTYTPVKHINNVLTTLMLEIAVPQDKMHEVEQTLTSWSESVIGEVYTMGNWNLLITPQPPTPGVAKEDSPLGDIVPELMVLEFQMIENGIISNAVQWTINGQAVDLSSDTISINRNPDVKPMANQGYCVASNQYQDDSIVMTLAYKTTTIMKKIVEDLLDRNKDEVYTITRNDGFAETFTEDCIITNGSIVEQSGKIVAVTLTFRPVG